MPKLSYTVRNLEKKMRLSDFVHVAFPHLISRKAGQKAIKRGWVTVNCQPGSSGIWVQNGDELVLNIPIAKVDICPFDISVVYEDDHLAVVIKPAGINVSGNRKALSHYLNGFLQSTKAIDQIYPFTNVHRLDRDTKGLLMIAKTKSAQLNLQKQFTERTIEKVYHAVVIGKLYRNMGTVEEPLYNKNAVTNYHVIKETKSNRFTHLSLLRLTIETGRTHQIRQHLSMLGHPIVGDKIYNDHKPIGNGKGMFLFATGLKFIHPFEQKKISLTMSLPPKVQRLMNGH